MGILRQDTDEQNPITKNELCERFGQLGISCDLRTMTRDIALLNEQGYEIMDKQKGHEKCYYIEAVRRNTCLP